MHIRKTVALCGLVAIIAVGCGESGPDDSTHCSNTLSPAFLRDVTGQKLVASEGAPKEGASAACSYDPEDGSETGLHVSLLAPDKYEELRDMAGATPEEPNDIGSGSWQLSETLRRLVVFTTSDGRFTVVVLHDVPIGGSGQDLDTLRDITRAIDAQLSDET